MASLPLLTLLCVVFVASVVESAKLKKDCCPPSHVSCKCGRNGTKIRVPVRRCLKFDGFKQYCDDCAPPKRLKRICRKFSRCKACNQRGCTECPHNKHGRRCNKKCDGFCQNGGTCTGPLKACICPEGYKGKRCEKIEDKECTIITKPANGNVIVTGRKATYTCAPGYSLNGVDEVVCERDGVWSFDAPTCDPVCTVPNDTDHMHYEKLEGRDGMVYRLEATCDYGYKISGSSVIACSADGTWSSRPICVKKKTCQDPGPLDNGVIEKDDTGDEYFEGAVLSFSCYEGYGMENDINRTDVTLTCQATGAWSSRIPRCVRKPSKIVTCPAPMSIDHGETVPGSVVRRPHRYEAGLRIVYSCEDGYQLEPNITERFCLTNGNWFPRTSPVCISENSCPEPVVSNQIERCFYENCTKDRTKQVHGVVTFKGRYNNGTYMEFKCASSHRKLNGTRSITCQENGTWSDSVPECVADRPPECGKANARSRLFIAHGQPDSVMKWPWHTIVRAKKNNWSMCGGALLGDSWIITAAHCVTKENTTVPLDSTDISVELGRQFLNVTHDSTRHQRPLVSAVRVNPKYSAGSWDSDIALLKLATPVVITDRVKPLCIGREPLPHEEDSNLSGLDHHHMITGFGKYGGEKRSEPHSNELRMDHVNVETNRTRCMLLLRQYGVSKTVTDNMFCAGGAAYPCSGDSGGPLFSMQKDKGGKRWFIQGVISWGPTITCGNGRAYTVFTKVSRFVDWIKNVTSEDLIYNL